MPESYWKRPSVAAEQRASGKMGWTIALIAVGILILTRCGAPVLQRFENAVSANQGPDVWTIRAGDATRIVGVWLSGYYTRQVVGLGSDVAVLRTSYRDGSDCAYAACRGPPVTRGIRGSWT